VKTGLFRFKAIPARFPETSALTSEFTDNEQIMNYRLSILDKSPIPKGADAAEALRNTLSLAVRAEQLNYHRYWFTEHHGVPQLASAAPEVLAAFVLARTHQIRVGTGGVMLRHYAPYKVAETFNLLAALAPDRVDLGVGKAPGGLPPSTRALQLDRGLESSFDARLTDLDGFLSGTLPTDHPLADAVVTPRPRTGPERILLGASVESAELAARLDWQFCYAGQFNGDPDHVARAFEAYRRSSGRNSLLTVVAFAAEKREVAEQHVINLRIYRVRLDNGESVNLPSLEAAESFIQTYGASQYPIEELKPSILFGTGEQVHDQLKKMQRQFGVDEFVLDAPVADFAARLRSLELLSHSVS
jgi:luciferase family oxidoreductase group 1